MKNWPFALWGGDGSDDDGVDGDDGSSEELEASTTYTQDELDKAVARAANRAARRQAKELRQSLGFETHDELTAFVEGSRASQEAQQTEAEKLQAELEQERNALLQDRQSLSGDRLNLAVDRNIILSGVTDEAKVKRIRTLVRSELGNDVDPETMDDDVAEALESVMNDVPSLFEIASGKNKGSGDGGANEDKLTDQELTQRRNKEWEAEYAKKGMISAP